MNDLTLQLFSLTPAARRADNQLSALGSDARAAFAQLAQARASSLGLRRGDDEIPLVLSPCSLPREELHALGHAARLIVSALVKVARELIDRRADRAKLLFHHLSPLEQEALRTRSHEAEELLIARVDWFVDQQGRARALEVNATIPAMPVYSDAAVRGYLEALAPARARHLAERNGSNASWLLDGLLHAAQGRPRKVQLLHREGDPQRTELLALVDQLRARGCEARTVTPAEVLLDGSGILYRHLFARHVEPQSALGKAFLDPVRHGLWNRVDGWLETKGLLGELSAHGEGDAALLTPEEREAVRLLVPWTRLLDDVSDSQLGDGDAYILKRSHDYGGKSVVIGREAGPAAFRSALSKARLDEPGSWVAQGLVDAPAIPRWVCRREGARVGPVRAPLHLDISTYASLIDGVPEGGSVCRAAPGRVVNIVGGGGVAPLFADDVLAEALDA